MASKNYSLNQLSAAKRVARELALRRVAARTGIPRQELRIGRSIRSGRLVQVLHRGTPVASGVAASEIR